MGSNLNLVAPVEIKDKAFIAAGTTITKNVDEEKMLLAKQNKVVGFRFKGKCFDVGTMANYIKAFKEY